MEAFDGSIEMNQATKSSVLRQVGKLVPAKTLLMNKLNKMSNHSLRAVRYGISIHHFDYIRNISNLTFVREILKMFLQCVRKVIPC